MSTIAEIASPAGPASTETSPGIELPHAVAVGDSGPTFWRYASRRLKEVEWINAAKTAAGHLDTLLATNENAALALLVSVGAEIVLYDTPNGLTVYIDADGIGERGVPHMSSCVPNEIRSKSECAAYLAATPLHGCVRHPKELCVYVTHELDEIARDLIKAAEEGTLSVE